MAIIRKYPAKVASITNEVDDIFTVEFESLSKPFRYECGQFLHLITENQIKTDERE
ncbi:MAG TPA: hypothetical protein VK152_11985 [Paludibacter sp.]|nr:hypothetical protein [Paludibacter sp.]